MTRVLQLSLERSMITLSTCEYSHKNGRMVVVGKKLNKKHVNEPFAAICGKWLFIFWK